MWHLAKRYKRRYPELDIQDLAAEIRVSFLAAARNYNPTSGARFSTYAPHFSKIVQRYVEREMGGGATARDGERIPFGFVAAGDVDAAPEPDRNGKQWPGFWEHMRAVAGEPAGTLLELRYRDGLTITECARRMQYTLERAQRAEAAALKQLRTAGFRPVAEGDEQPTTRSGVRPVEDELYFVFRWNGNQWALDVTHTSGEEAIGSAVVDKVVQPNFLIVRWERGHPLELSLFQPPEPLPAWMGANSATFIGDSLIGSEGVQKQIQAVLINNP